jgi:hypothetical protein
MSSTLITKTKAPPVPNRHLAGFNTISIVPTDLEYNSKAYNHLIDVVALYNIESFTR